MNLGVTHVRRNWIRLLILMLFLVWGLPAPTYAKQIPIDVIDSRGNRLSLAAPPRRIVSLVPSASEVLVAIGAGALVAGTTYHDITLEGSDKRAVVGGFFNPSLVRIQAVNPDLVIASSFHKEIVYHFKSAGIPVFIHETASLEQAWDLMANLGRITGHEKEAGDLVRKNREGLAHIRAKLEKAGARPRRVIRLMGRDRIMTPGKGSFQNEMIRAAGGIPPDLDKPGNIVGVTLEEWKAFNPEVIYGCGGDRNIADRFFARPGWKDVSAVQNHEIHYLPCDLTCRASARTADFVAQLAAMVHAPIFAREDLFVRPLEKVGQAPLDGVNLDYVANAAIVRSHIYDFVNKTLVIDLKRPMAVVSTLEGYRENITTVSNHYSPPPTWMAGHAKGIDHIRTSILSAIGRKGASTSLLMTGADMDNISVQTRRFKKMEVTALVTAGVISNAVRMAEDEGLYYEPGTINIIILTNMKLSPRAMTRAVISATEAKSALLQDMDIRSAYSGKLHMATGTGTDNVLVVQGEGLPIDNAGGHSKMGELIARAVYAGVQQAVSRQNGVLPGRHLIRRLKERKISIYEITSGAQCNCEGRKSQFSAMVEHLLLNPEYAGFMEAALSLSDAYEQGLVRDLKSFDLWCLGVAEKISGQKIDKLEGLVTDRELPLVLQKAMDAVMTGARIRVSGE